MNSQETFGKRMIRQVGRNIYDFAKGVFYVPASVVSDVRDVARMTTNVNDKNS